MIQTYSPDNYAVTLGASQDYESFYQHEMSYRQLLGYPPCMNMLAILVASEQEPLLDESCRLMNQLIAQMMHVRSALIKIGPTRAPIAKIQDKYRKIIYLKSPSYEDLTFVKDGIEKELNEHPDNRIQVTFDFSMNTGGY